MIDVENPDGDLVGSPVELNLAGESDQQRIVCITWIGIFPQSELYLEQQRVASSVSAALHTGLISGRKLYSEKSVTRVKSEDK